MTHLGDIAPPTLVHDPDGFPATVGPYRIIRVLGQGGMGTVYLAEQTEPVQREVALKVLRAGVDHDLFIARFAAERQALAVMEHPNITKVFDAGVTESGWPYFVMERVVGMPLTDYADEHRLSIRDRLRLVAQICGAVQHAHQKGIIHRDLKPSNVMVTEEAGAPVCKVIDFGIARATAVAEMPNLTMTGLSLGTPAYMSPEQASGSRLDVDTRSDIYSLGVMLYELLAGSLPFDPDSYRGLAMLAQHAAGEVVRPSVRVARLAPEERESVAALRSTDAPKLVASLRGDLDWIVLRAMEKERERRYETASAFALDLERHLAHQAVLASPPTRAYRTRKFVRRHRAGVGFAATTALLLVAFSITATVQAQRLARARTTAEQRQAQAEELIGFMVGDLRTSLSTLGRLDLLDKVGSKSQAYFAAVPESELSAEESYRRSQALRQIGEIRVDQGRLDTAMTLFRQSLVLATRLADRDSLNDAWQLGLGASHYWVGFVHYRKSELDSALVHFAPYLRITERLVARAPDSLRYRLELGDANSNIGSALEAKGDLGGALSAFRRKLVIAEDLVRRDSTKVEWKESLANNYNAVGVIQHKLGDLAGAERSQRAELALKLALLRRDSTNSSYQDALVNAYALLAPLLLNEGDHAAALQMAEQALGLAERVAAADTANPTKRWRLATTSSFVGVAQLERGELLPALSHLDAGRVILEALVARAPGESRWQGTLARLRAELGTSMSLLGRVAEAERVERAALANMQPALAKRPSDQSLRIATARATLALGDVLERQGHVSDARQVWEQALATVDSTARATGITDFLALHSAALLRLDRVELARPIVQELLGRGYRRPRWLSLVHTKGLDATAASTISTRKR